MQQIERYGVIALVFLLVTIVAVSFWGDSKSPGFWARLTGRGVKKDATSQQVSNMIPPATSTERAIDPNLPLTTGEGAAVNGLAAGPAPDANTWSAPAPATAGGAAPANDAWTNPPAAPVASSEVARPNAGYAPAPTERAPAMASAPSAPVSRAVDTQTSGTGQPYVVQKGDSLIRIAAKTLGSGKRWTEIQTLNGGLDPRDLHPGMKLVLPATARLPKSGATPAAQPKSGAKPAASGSGTYVVRAGDTLSKIAARALGDDGRWREIVAANPNLDPKRLLVGTSIRIPDAGRAPSAANRAPVLASAAPRQVPAEASDRPRVR